MTLAARLVPVEAGTPVRICEHARGGPYCGRAATVTLHVTHSPGACCWGDEQYDRCDQHPPAAVMAMILDCDPGATFRITRAGER